ncbi:kelch-like protein 21 [Dreissena polymorpha]|uniref:kelch-like protein 21 n=1 Tax=Dreissena polymorpha TaxID=45954 RepID=UPI0022646D7C|nr:kelch-like protein 21 [Dreissena polymorpha]XP_052263522.1 kelch-like protein 21 [Dreissena polymorpha]XP_052263523.1 kelch-like protein 21 [Dreissena polymorpha]XP_052263524.1 kelch-like protein 21 [Dreissena polymorpha]XP_052263525.1 kelch-like protein 21 [Dreissena polymorpha]XP_052263526.1 kelch-like protein 21 [Dreissena polymorpha]XP_052263527.1 kelch-like protein 21 [Dreissena polymorpha]XP_052263528.1 kelch-like protein 21 [Dreissena polymorpha]XP_052263529.1 kelch-like protein 2
MSAPHFTRLSAGLTRLRENGHLLNASIPTQTTSVALHGVVIALFSQPIRQKLIQTGKCDLSLVGYSHASVDNLVQFLYGGKRTIGPECGEIIQTLHLDLIFDKTMSINLECKDRKNSEEDANLEFENLRNRSFETEVPLLLKATRPLADVKIKIATHLHRCHKVILSAISEFFEVMFSSGMKEATDEIITLQGIKNNVFKDVLNYIYTGQISVNSGNAQAVLSTAVYLQITSLQSLCEHFLLPTIDNTNCVELWKFAETYNCVLLQTGCWDYILDHFLEIKTLLVKRLQLNDIQKLIKDDNLYVNSEYDVLQFVLKWIINNKGSGSLENLLMHIRLSHLETDELHHLLHHKFVEKNPQLCAQVKETIDIRNETMFSHHLPRKEKCLLVIGHDLYDNIEIQCYSLSGKSWYRLNSFPSFLYTNCMSRSGWSFLSGSASCFNKTNVYFTGGEENLRSFCTYSVKSNSCSKLAEMNEERCCHAIGCINDVVYVLGGKQYWYGQYLEGCDPLCTIEKFDHKVNQWITLSVTLNIPVFNSAYACVKSKIFLFGGSNGEEYLKDIQCFDSALETCTTLHHQLPIPNTFIFGAACTNNSDVYIVCEDGNVIFFNEETSPPKVFYRKQTKFVTLGAITVFHENKILVMSAYYNDTVGRFDILCKNYDYYDETTLPFEGHIYPLFAAVMHVDKMFLDRGRKGPMSFRYGMR